MIARLKHHVLSSRLARRHLLPWLANRAYRRAGGGRDLVALDAIDNLGAGQAEFHLERRTLRPSTIEARPPSRALQEDALALVLNGTKLVGAHRAALEARSRDASEIYFSSLAAYTRYPTPEAFSCEISDALVYAPEGAVCVADGTLLAESLFAGRPRTFPRRPDSIPYLPGRYISLLTWDGDVNYAHWLMDAIPRLALAGPLPPDTRVLVPSPVQPFHRDLPLLAGVAADSLTPVEPGWYRIEHLTLLRTSDRAIVPRSDLLREVRATVRRGAGHPETGIPSRRVWLSRSGVRRSIANEDELHATLTQHGFEIVQPEKLSQVDQVRLFAETAVLAGYHGAGNHNVLFMNEGTKLIEILNPALFDHGVARTAACLGIEHWYAFAEDLGHGSNARLDPAKLDRLLQYALAEGDATDARY
jgi:capsular polysaccharide biosynthesis protein